MKWYPDQDYLSACAATVAHNLFILSGGDAITIYGVPRGGIPAAYLVMHAYHQLDTCGCSITDNPSTADYIIDDLIDSGATKRRYYEHGAPFFALIDKKEQSVAYKPDWIVFPWEVGEDGDQSATDIPMRLLQFINEDVERGGLKETPARFLKAWQFWTSGYAKKPEDILKVFEDGADNYDEMVLVKNIPLYSQCEHHLAPFFGVAHIAYIPNGKIVGLSKLSRIVDLFARRLQVQERLTNQISESINKHLEPTGVGVVLECRHLCMESRGICQQGHSTTTSSMHGAFKDNTATRLEFLKLIKE